MKRRPIRAVAAALAALLSAGLLASCTSGGGNDQSSGFVVSAPSDCLVNAYCGRGLAAVYGVDLTGHVKSQPEIDASVSALKDGKADVAVVFSSSPYPRDPELVVLKDDRSMVASENVTPVYRATRRGLYGGTLVRDLDTISALITPASLQAIDASLAGGASDQAAATEWLRTAAPAPANAVKKTGPVLRIGSTGFAENRALSRVLAGYLADRGYPTEVKVIPGGRAAVVDALANGDIDLTSEYSASLLEYLNGFRGEATADSAATAKRLRQYLDLIGAKAARPSTATSSNVFVTTKKESAARGLTALSDLAKVGLPAVPTTPPTGSISGPAELGILVRSTNHQLAIGSKGAEVRDVQERLTQLGYSVPVTGVYDAATVTAVRAFQTAQGLPPVGVTGPATERALARAKASSTPGTPVSSAPAAATPPAARTGGGGKVIYLTFDDGPAVTYTPQILNLLDRYNAKATFFELGENASAHPKLTRDVVARGHALASHTWDHADMTRLSTTALNSEITQTAGVLDKFYGRRVTCLRPPYGAINGQVRRVVAGQNLTVHLWDIDPQDWNRPGTASIVNTIVSGARPGAVSLMHDGGGDRSQSVAALAQILPRLAAKGYRFEALPGC